MSSVGPPLKATWELTLESFNSVTGTAVITGKQTIDSQSFARGMDAFLKKFNVDIEKSPEEIPLVECVTDMKSIIDPKTSWVETLWYRRTMTAGPMKGTEIWRFERESDEASAVHGTANLGG